MIKQARNIPRTCRERARGGKGVSEMLALLNADEFCNKGTMFNHVTLKPGASVGYHEHKGDFEVYYLLKGQATYNDNGTDYRLVAGDLTICNDGEGHSIENTGAEDLEFIALILYSN